MFPGFQGGYEQPGAFQNPQQQQGMPFLPPGIMPGQIPFPPQPILPNPVMPSQQQIKPPAPTAPPPPLPQRHQQPQTKYEKYEAIAAKREVSQAALHKAQIDKLELSPSLTLASTLKKYTAIAHTPSQQTAAVSSTSSFETLPATAHCYMHEAIGSKEATCIDSSGLGREDALASLAAALDHYDGQGNGDDEMERPVVLVPSGMGSGFVPRDDQRQVLLGGSGVAAAGSMMNK